MRRRRTTEIVLPLAAALAIAGCGAAPAPDRGAERTAAPAAGTHALSFEPVTRAGEPGTPFAVAGGFGGAVARLRAAGLEVTGQDAASGTISGRSQSNALIDCGEGVITDGPDVRRFAANSEMAVVPAPGSTGNDFDTRELATTTEFRVDIAGTAARVSETHQAELTVSPLAGGDPATSRLAFQGSQIGAFRDGMTCTSSGEIRRLLQ